MVIYCILTGLAVYYIALWLWYRYTDSRTSTSKADDVSLPQNKVSSYTLVGESRYKSGLIGTAQDKSGHLPQTAGNDTIFAPQAGEQSEENISEATPEAEETPGYENDEPDYEDEEIAGYMDGDDDTGRATGVSFDELGEAVRTANADNPTEAEQRQAAGTLASIEGTNLYDAVVENINGGASKGSVTAGAHRSGSGYGCCPCRNWQYKQGTRSVRHERLPLI
ncbi:Conjugative transposon protein TraD [Bacteroides xylanisolvens SD CC 2a]|nr:Conjugative transposon protein TraD [Bacteroides xylanisolvens SD CC 2a]